LIRYGAIDVDMYRQAGVYVGRILRGGSPTGLNAAAGLTAAAGTHLARRKAQAANSSARRIFNSCRSSSNV
jgi:hypothetical protein